jgi:hypothetical protein
MLFLNSLYFATAYFGIVEVLKCVFFLLKVRHHESVKIHSEDPTRGRVEGSEGGQVPEKYIVVRNNDLLHIRYRTDIITRREIITVRGQSYVSRLPKY